MYGRAAAGETLRNGACRALKIPAFLMPVINSTVAGTARARKVCHICICVSTHNDGNGVFNGSTRYVICEGARAVRVPREPRSPRPHAISAWGVGLAYSDRLLRSLHKSRAQQTACHSDRGEHTRCDCHDRSTRRDQAKASDRMRLGHVVQRPSPGPSTS